jgi:hypothetical protein
MLHPETHIRIANISHGETATAKSRQYRQMKDDQKAKAAREAAWSKPLPFNRAPRGTFLGNARRTLLGWI